FALPVPALLGWLSRAFRDDLRRLNRFTPDDWSWLRGRDRRATVGGRGIYPVGKYNAGQKLNAAFSGGAGPVGARPRALLPPPLGRRARAGPAGRSGPPGCPPRPPGSCPVPSGARGAPATRCRGCSSGTSRRTGPPVITSYGWTNRNDRSVSPVGLDTPSGIS